MRMIWLVMGCFATLGFTEYYTQSLEYIIDPIVWITMLLFTFVLLKSKYQLSDLWTLTKRLIGGICKNETEIKDCNAFSCLLRYCLYASAAMIFVLSLLPLFYYHDQPGEAFSLKPFTLAFCAPVTALILDIFFLKPLELSLKRAEEQPPLVQAVSS